MSARAKSLKLAVQQSPDNLPLLLLYGNACMEELLLADAREAFLQIMSIDPGNADAKLGLALVVQMEGKTSEAIVRMEQLLDEHLNHGPIWIALSRILAAVGEMHRARELYYEGLNIDSALADPTLEQALEEGRRRAGLTGVRDYLFEDEAGDDDFDEADFDSDDDDDDSDGESFSAGDVGVELELTDIEKPKLKFTDVGGMNEVKEEIRMKIIYPLQHAELFKAYDKKPGGGVLLYGPPGCGKTLLSKATAGEIKANFIALGLHQILDLWMGNTEKNIRELFELARRNAPCVLFFDEVDALAADRREMRHSAGRNLINQFLGEMDGSESDNDGVLILGATNAPWHIDPAFRRPGRFDRALFVPPPDEAARISIIEVMSRKKPIADLDAEALAKKTEGFSGADLRAVFDLATEQIITQAMSTGQVIPLHTKDLVKAAARHKPTTKAWFESAKNYAVHPNHNGFYDEVLKYLNTFK